MIEATGSTAPSTAELIEKWRRLLADAPGVLVAYLYGSHARGQAGPLSDVDVAVLIDSDNVLIDSDDEERRLALTASIADTVAPARADVVVLNHAPVALSYRVLRNGTVLAARDQRARAEHWVPRSIATSTWLRPGACWRPALGTGYVRAALVDAEVVGRRLREIGRRLAELRDIRSHSESVFLTDTALQAQAERHLQLALQCAIDIALHILADDTDQTPEDYGSAYAVDTYLERPPASAVE